MKKNNLVGNRWRQTTDRMNSAASPPPSTQIAPIVECTNSTQPRKSLGGAATHLTVVKDKRYLEGACQVQVDAVGVEVQMIQLNHGFTE